RHASDAPQSRIAPLPEHRIYLAVLVVAVGVVGALVRWATSTWVLGANLAAPVHVTLVTLFLSVVAVATYVVAWQGYPRAARWSQERRARQHPGQSGACRDDLT